MLIITWEFSWTLHGLGPAHQLRNETQIKGYEDRFNNMPGLYLFQKVIKIGETFPKKQFCINHCTIILAVMLHHAPQK